MDLLTAGQLRRGKDAVLREKRHILFLGQVGKGLRRGTQVKESPAFRLLLPFLAVSVPVQENSSLLLQRYTPSRIVIKSSSGIPASKRSFLSLCKVTRRLLPASATSSTP